jgi:arabinogalactan endo-1,4-beta-galactosidase
VKALGKRIKDAGMLLMLDFHYSDTWADPAKQWTPAEWLSLNNDQLYTKIYEYTKDCLEQMNAAGASPDFIQTGNEISYGMLWGATGSNANRCYVNSDANWPRFTTLLKQAGKACREICPQAKIILHIERVAQPNVIVNFYNQMKNKGVDYDIIGLSYYPYFHGDLSKLETAISTVETNFNKPIQIVETGYPSQYAIGGSTFDYTATYPYTNAGQKAFTADLITLLKNHPRVNGLSWWYPEANAKGCTGDLKNGWYNAGLFNNNNGKALDAFYELKNFR